MTFENSFMLQQMQDNAKKQYKLNLDRIENINELLLKQMDGQTMPKIIFGIIGAALWVVFYFYLFSLIMSMQESPFATIALVLSLIMMLLCIWDRISRFRYYGSITKTRTRLFRITESIESSAKGLPSELRILSDMRDSGWREALNPGESIPEELDLVEQAISNMSSLQSGFLQKAKVAFFFLTALAWTVAGCIAMEDMLYPLFSGDFSYTTIHTMMIIGTIIAFIAEIFVARLLWSMTDCKVTNVTLFATCTGPILFGLLGLVAALLIWLVAIVFKLLVGLIVLFVGGSIAFGMCCGG